MALVSNSYGKGRVRVLRLHKDGAHHAVRELNVEALMTGDFGALFTHGDNAKAISTDTVKNLINIVARENLDLGTEAFCAAVCQRFLDRYPQVVSVDVTAHETKWVRYGGDNPHPHAFTLDSNGRPFVKLTGSRTGMTTTSGIAGFTFMKTTQSGWDKYEKDSYTTIRETRDRICATSMEASWVWASAPADYAKANALILDTMIDVFVSTYSESVQDSMYRMAMAALAAVPQIVTISMACPNKHYIPINLAAFDLTNDNMIFLPTDEPHGQIECTVGRDD
jgi:urate oxidase